MSLYAVAELLKKIENGIKHQAQVSVTIDEFGLKLHLSFTINRERMAYCHVFFWRSMIEDNDDLLIQHFMDEMNARIRSLFLHMTKSNSREE